MGFGFNGQGNTFVRLSQLVGTGSPGAILPYQPQAGVAPRLLGQGEVAGFTADTLERTMLAGLPSGVAVPGELQSLIVAARRVDAWVDKGRLVQAWAEGRGVTDASWIDPETDELALPESLRGEDVPSFVTTWLAEASEIEAIIEALAVR